VRGAASSARIDAVVGELRHRGERVTHVRLVKLAAEQQRVAGPPDAFCSAAHNAGAPMRWSVFMTRRSATTACWVTP
jgi:hypothetical protein